MLCLALVSFRLKVNTAAALHLKCVLPSCDGAAHCVLKSEVPFGAVLSLAQTQKYMWLIALCCEIKIEK